MMQPIVHTFFISGPNQCCFHSYNSPFFFFPFISCILVHSFHIAVYYHHILPLFELHSSSLYINEQSLPEAQQQQYSLSITWQNLLMNDSRLSEHPQVLPTVDVDHHQRLTHYHHFHLRPIPSQPGRPSLPPPPLLYLQSHHPKIHQPC